MKEGKWQEALDAVDRCIRVYEPRIKTLGLDDGFGWFYYQKGVCLAQLKQYKEAVEAFKACYTKFPSAKNQLVKMALFREGENYCRLGDFAKGAELLEKFLKEYRSDPVARNVNAGEVQGLLAQCYFKMDPPAFEKGLENLTSCVTSRYKGRRITGCRHHQRLPGDGGCRHQDRQMPGNGKICGSPSFRDEHQPHPAWRCTLPGW